MREIKSIEIKHDAHVGTARRAVHEFASRADFSETELAEIDIVVQEIGTNAVRYATGGGWLHFALTLGEARGLELFYCDAGPGIYNMDRAIRDGVSTSGSMGSGLGAIRRLMDEFDVYSTVRETKRLRSAAVAARRTSHGTAMLARKWVGGTEDKLEQISDARRFGVWSRPHPKEEANGDAYFIRERGGRTLLAVIDGLGHGHGAKEAADVALEVLGDWMGEPLEELFQTIHNALRATRGAVMAAVIIDDEPSRIQYAGVGNIEVRVINAPEPVTTIPVHGTLGARFNQVRVWTHEWSRDALIVMASDGLSARWDIDAYPGLAARSPQLIAGILMRDYSRAADDATVLVAR
ncbi:MAG: ATP-binding protein [Pyrinomonadaceae bacterium]